VSFTSYDPATDAVLKTITDVDYNSLTGDEQDSFDLTGWSQPSGGLHLVTTMAVDNLGRHDRGERPEGKCYCRSGNVTYMVYNDPKHEVRVYSGFDGTNTTGPIQISP